MTNASLLTSALTDKRWDDVASLFREALAHPIEEAETLSGAVRGLARAGQKGRLQSLMGEAEAALGPASKDPAVARLRWTLLKEAVRAGATPSTSDGFHRLFESALAAAYPGSVSRDALLGRFKFREAKDPADGMARLDKVEKWLPFEVGGIFAMPGRGVGKVVETNFALDAVRVDFEKAKGISVPIGVAAKSMVALPEGHFLRDKLSDPAAAASAALADPGATLRRILDSFGRPLSLTELKEALWGAVPEEKWTSWWTAARKHPQVVVHGGGKTATVEWSHSADAASDTVFAKFEKADLDGKLDLFRKSAKRSADLEKRMAEILAAEAIRWRGPAPARAFEIAALVDKSVDLPFTLASLLPEKPVAFLSSLTDRATRERALDLVAAERPAEAASVLAEWLFKEEDGRTLDLLDRRLAALDAALRDATIDRLLKNPKFGPRAFLWFAQRASTDEAYRAKLTPAILGRLVDAVAWPELQPQKSKLRELFDRTGLVAQWLVKQATVDEARSFLEALQRPNDLEVSQRITIIQAAEMRFPELRRRADDGTFFATPESIEEKRAELDRILKVEIPENRKAKELAAAEGDLSENFEYKARKEKETILSARAGKLQDELAHARPLDAAAVDTTEVRPGTRVTLRGASGTRTLTLLGPWDSKPEAGVYSYLSDLGKALLGKTAGESAIVLGENAVVEQIAPWR